MQRTILATDHHQWAMDTADAISRRRLDQIDWERVAEEIYELGISQEHALQSHLAQLMYHLLKMEHQPERHGRSWEITVRAQRNIIYSLLKKQPSLKALLRDDAFMNAAYDAALAESGRDNLPDSVVMHFPEACPYKVDMLLPDLGADSNN
ncbi:MAG: DUF29 domain-containing protein [Acidobacteriaceae bacterium]|nr:DUF29 domain-containing protein [Acidobacteriaceae bacterium]